MAKLLLTRQLGNESLNNLVSQIAKGLFTTLNTQTFFVNGSGQNALTQTNNNTVRCKLRPQDSLSLSRSWATGNLCFYASLVFHMSYSASISLFHSNNCVETTPTEKSTWSSEPYWTPTKLPKGD